MTTTINWQSLTERQRDTLIATHMMGWKQVSVDCPHGDDCDVCTLYESPDGSVYLLSDQDGVPRYTTSMDAAWLVLSKLKNTDQWGTFCFELDEILTHHRLNWNLAQKGQYITWFEQFLAALNAEAICMAALKAVGYHIELEQPV
jgi:hypothetical protein